MSLKSAVLLIITVVSIVGLGGCNLLNSSMNSDDTCTVTYNGNGNSAGTVPIDSSAYIPGGTVTVLGNNGSLENGRYTFAGWNTVKDGTGVGYSGGNTFAVFENTVLYAVWTVDPTFSVTYDGNGNTDGAVPIDENNYLQDAAAAVMADANNLSQNGYPFAEWNTKADGTGTAYASGSTLKIGDENITLYARWKTAEWAKILRVESYDYNSFSEMTMDEDGNIYSIGYIRTRDETLGVTASTQVLVKFDGSGKVLKVITVPAGAVFEAVALDGAGNMYLAGHQNGTAIVTYGEGLSIAGSYSDWNALIVKYDSSGTALWAKTVSTASHESCFCDAAVDASGNVYAVGYQCYDDQYRYGTNVTLTGSASNFNAVIVKYETESGDAQWANAVTSGAYRAWSQFQTAAVDGSGNVYAAGFQHGTGMFTYKSGSSTTRITAEGTADGNNAALAKYDPDGNALWAKSVGTGTQYSEFVDIAVDTGGTSVYASGYQEGTGCYTYGTGVSAQHTSLSTNAVLVSYNALSGEAQWARTVETGTGSLFNGVAADGGNYVYAAGYQVSPYTYTYAEGVTATGLSGNRGDTAVLVKYDAYSGTAQWARIVTVNDWRSSRFGNVIMNGSGVYTIGSHSRTPGSHDDTAGTYQYGSGVRIEVKATDRTTETVIAKYLP